MICENCKDGRHTQCDEEDCVCCGEYMEEEVISLGRCTTKRINNQLYDHFWLNTSFPFPRDFGNSTGATQVWEHDNP